MTIPVQCPACLKEYGLRDDLEGKRVRCKECGENISVPRLRTISGNAAETARRATTKSTPAKPKPTTKPKPAATRHNDDDLVLEDDDEFEDEIGEPDEYESVPRRRSPATKHRKQKTGQGFSGFSKLLASIVGGMKFKISPFFLLMIGCLGACIITLLAPAALKPVVVIVAFGGIALMIVSSLWMVVATFRVSAGWGIVFILSGLANMGLVAAGHPGIGLAINMVCFLFSIMLIPN